MQDKTAFQANENQRMISLHDDTDVMKHFVPACGHAGVAIIKFDDANQVASSEVRSLESFIND